MPIKFYEFPASPFCRSVKLIASLINVPLDLQEVNLVEKGHLKPDYLKMNPFHQVPTIDDDGFYLAESRAIATYLIDKYAPDHALYPKDVQKRASIDQMLYFDSGTLSPSLHALTRPFHFQNALAPPEAFQKAKETYSTLDLVLSKRKYVAGDNLTIADIAIRASLTMNESVQFFDDSEYKNITAWKQKVKDETSPAYIEINDNLFEKYKTMIDERRAKLNELLKNGA